MFNFTSVIVFGLIVAYSNTSLGQLQCAEIFERNTARDLEQILENGPLQEFLEAKSQFSQSKGLAQTNDSIYNMVINANQVFDHVVHSIVRINYIEMPKEFAALKKKEVTLLIEELQQTFGLGDNVMRTAIGYRVEQEVGMIQEKIEAANVRRAIGFGRDQSAEEFHADKPEPQPIGYVHPTRKVENEVEVEKLPIGFATRKNKEQLEESIEDVVEAAPKLSDTLSLESRSAEAPSESAPIGFIRPKKQSDRITEDKLHKIYLNLENGMFEMIKGEH